MKTFVIELIQWLCGQEKVGPKMLIFIHIQVEKSPLRGKLGAVKKKDKIVSM